MTGIMLVNPERFPHGTRARYVAGKCRCESCTVANRVYARARYHGEHNGVVDSSAARAHLEVLRKAGVGTRAVSAAADVSRTVLKKILTGAPARANIVRRVLAVDVLAASDGAYIPAGPTRAVVRELVRWGMTKTEIAQRIGQGPRPVQLGKKRVTARHAFQLRRLYEEIRLSAHAAAGFDFCRSCGDSHSPERRHAWLRRVDLTEREAIHDERPCWWPRTKTGQRKLGRDIASVRVRQPEQSTLN